MISCFSLSLGGRNRVYCSSWIYHNNYTDSFGVFFGAFLGLGGFQGPLLCQRSTAQDHHPRLDGSQGPLFRLVCSMELLSRLDGSQGPLIRLGDLRDLSTGRGVLGDHSLELADPRDLSTGWRVLGDLSLDWGDLRDLSTGWGVLGDLSFDGWFLWDQSSELDRDLVFSWSLTWDCGLFW